LKIGLEVGAASGDSAPRLREQAEPPEQPDRADLGRVRRAVGRLRGRSVRAASLHRPRRRPSDPPCLDTDIRNFRFNQDYRIDLILWREIIGGITDAST
jgi:hypothetical protein